MASPSAYVCVGKPIRFKNLDLICRSLPPGVKIIAFFKNKSAKDNVSNSPNQSRAVAWTPLTPIQADGESLLPAGASEERKHDPEIAQRVNALHDHLKSCIELPSEKALAKGLCTCKDGTNCSIRGHHHDVGALEGVARRLKEKKPPSSSGAVSGGAAKNPPKPKRWVKCACERACECPYGELHAHRSGKKVSLDDLLVAGEERSTPESLASAGATLKSILGASRRQVDQDAEWAAIDGAQEAAFDDMHGNNAEYYESDDDALPPLEEGVDELSAEEVARICDEIASEESLSMTQAVESKYDGEYPRNDGWEATPESTTTKWVAPPNSGAGLGAGHARAFALPDSVARAYAHLEKSEHLSNPASRVPVVMTPETELALEMFNKSSVVWKIGSGPSTVFRYPDGEDAASRGKFVHVPTIPAIEEIEEPPLALWGNAKSDGKRIGVFPEALRPRKRDILFGILREPIVAHERTLSPLRMARAAANILVDLPILPVEEPVPVTVPEPVIPVVIVPVIVPVPPVAVEVPLAQRIINCAVYVRDAKRSAERAGLHSESANRARLSSSESEVSIGTRTRAVLVYRDNGKATTVKTKWYRKWQKYAAKTPLGDMARNYLVNTAAGATLRESSHQAIKEVSEFYWFWQTPRSSAEREAKEMDCTTDKLARDDILYFLNYFTHHETVRVYDVLCESILRDQKFLARRSTLLEEGAGGLLLSRTTVLAVDDLVSRHASTVRYGAILDPQVMADTRTHILNQLLLYGLMARASQPLKGGDVAIGQARSGRARVLFRKGGPTDHASPRGLPSKLL